MGTIMISSWLVLLKFHVLFCGFVEPQPVFMSFSVSTIYYALQCYFIKVATRKDKCVLEPGLVACIQILTLWLLRVIRILFLLAILPLKSHFKVTGIKGWSPNEKALMKCIGSSMKETHSDVRVQTFQWILIRRFVSLIYFRIFCHPGQCNTEEDWH